MYTSVVFIHFSEEHTEVPLFFVLGQLHPRGLGFEVDYCILVAFFVFAKYLKEKISDDMGTVLI
jgi:hypothetical protein